MAFDEAAKESCRDAGGTAFTEATKGSCRDSSAGGDLFGWEALNTTHMLSGPAPAGWLKAEIEGCRDA